MNRLKSLRRKKHLTQQQLSKELKKRNIKVSVALISSYEQEKIIFVILKEGGISPGESVKGLSEERLAAAANKIKNFPLTVTGTNPFSKAQVCAGGVRLSEVTENLEAKARRGLYITGELLDVDAYEKVVYEPYDLRWLAKIA